MKNLLFVTLAHLSSGEFTIAVEFAKRLDKKKYNILFLTSEKGIKTITDNDLEYFPLKMSYPEKPEENRALFDGLIDEFKPDFVFLSDAYTTEFSYSWSGVNCALIKSLNAKVVNFDEYEYENTEYKLDYYGNYVKTVWPTLNKFDYTLRTCPLNKINPEETRAAHVSLYGDIEAKSDLQKREFKKSKFNDPNVKYVFTATSTWEEINVSRLPSLSKLLVWLPVMLLNYLNETGQNVVLVHVGPKKWACNADNVKYMHFNYLGPEEFEDYILHSDLFITTNIVSVTLSKAIMGLVPSIVFNNEKIINFNKLTDQVREKPEWYQRMAEDVKIGHPFKVFPFGWAKFLKVVLENNDYVSTFQNVCVFSITKAVREIKSHLFDKDAISLLRDKQRKYLARLKLLPSPDQILDGWNK